MNLPPGVRTSDLPGIYLRDEEEIEILAVCLECEKETLAPIFEGEFENTCECGGDLDRA